MLDLGALVGGFQGGANTGMDLLAKRRELEQQARAQAAQRAIAQGYINQAGGGGGAPGGAPGGMTPAPMPGATPMPGAGGAPGAAPGGAPQGQDPRQQVLQQLLTAKAAAPQNMRPGALPGMPGGRPQPGGQAPVTGAALGAPGGPPPAAMQGGGGAPGAGGPGLMPQQPQQPSRPDITGATPSFSGVAQPTGDAFQDSQQTVNRVFQELLKQNPSLKDDPQTLFTAAQQQIELMKGVGSDVRNMMLMQTGAAKLQYQYSSLADRHDKWVSQQQTQLQMLDRRLADKSLDRQTRLILQKMRDDTQSAIASDRNATIERGQDLSYAAREDSTDERAAASEAGIDEKGRESDNRDNQQQYRTDVGGNGRDGSTAAKAPTMQARRPTQLPRAQRRQPGGGRSGSYRSADQVVSDYKSGKLSRDQATQILKQNGWAS